MMSFNPHEMECPCCQGRILSEKNAGNSERRVFILSDQCFPPLALANPVKGQCLKIIRAEGATLWELFSVYYDILRKGQLHVPAGSAVLIGSASHLLDVSLAAYADEFSAVCHRLQSLHSGCVYTIPCPMLPMDGTSNPTMIRSIVELYSWLNSIMTNSICFCSATMKAALEILQRNQTDCVAAPGCRMLLPVSLTGTTSNKKWESGGTSLPCSLEPISSETEAAVLHSLILELNNKLGLKLDPLPDLSRVVDVGGFTGPPQVLVFWRQQRHSDCGCPRKGRC